VRLTSAKGHRIDVITDESGTFSVRVPVGVYSIIAGLKRPYHWPMGSCGGSVIVVARGQSRDVVVVCQAL